MYICNMKALALLVWKLWQLCPVDDVMSISSTSRCERCIHDILSTSFTSMYYSVYIVDIAMWTMYTRYRVNIVYIDVLSCLHRRHRDVNVVYTISCQHRLHWCTILFTSSTSRCERCIHDIVSTSFTSMYYPVYIVDIAMWTMHTRYRVNIVYIDIISYLVCLWPDTGWYLVTWFNTGWGEAEPGIKTSDQVPPRIGSQTN